jgi:hypothetical protein
MSSFVIDDFVIDDDTTNINFQEVRARICYDFLPDDEKKDLIIVEKRSIVEKSLPSLFDVDIPFRSGYQLLTSNNPAIVSTELDEGIVSETIQHSSLFMLFVLCCQRGASTGCPYQVPINCRVLNVSNLVCTEDGTNLMESATKQDLQNSFGEGDFSGLTFFGVIESNNDTSIDGYEFESPSRMSLMTKDVFKVADAVLHGRKAVKLSACHFKRACRFFNRVWGEIDENGKMIEFSDDRVLTSHDLHSFAMLMKGQKLNNAEGWYKFLADFKLERMFPFEENTHVLVQIRHFGEYFRALVPMDCGVSRGQHRCHAMGFLGTGFMDCFASAPLKRFTGGTFL